MVLRMIMGKGFSFWVLLVGGMVFGGCLEWMISMISILFGIIGLKRFVSVKV